MIDFLKTNYFFSILKFDITDTQSFWPAIAEVDEVPLTYLVIVRNVLVFSRITFAFHVLIGVG